MLSAIVVLLSRACWSSPVETTGDTPGAGAGTLQEWTGVRVYGGDITMRTRFTSEFCGIEPDARSTRHTQHKRFPSMLVQAPPWHEIPPYGERQHDWIEVSDDT